MKEFLVYFPRSDDPDAPKVLRGALTAFGNLKARYTDGDANPSAIISCDQKTHDDLRAANPTLISEELLVR